MPETGKSRYITEDQSRTPKDGALQALGIFSTERLKTALRKIARNSPR